MTSRLGWLVVLAMIASSCASYEVGAAGATPSPAIFAHRAASSQVVLYWNCTHPVPDRLRLEGVAQNPWEAQPVRSLEFELVGVDAGDRVVSETKGAAPNILLGTNQTTPFTLELKTVGSELRFDLYYHYRFLEPEKEASAVPARAASIILLAQEQRLVVRDVCSPLEHLTP